MAESLLTRLRALSPIISDIVKVSGAPGASIGILQRGEVIHTDHFGFRDVANQLPPDEHSIYYLSSLSKTFTAAMIAILVERGRMEWDTPVSQILPRFHHWDESVHNNANIVDFLAHKTGLAPKNNIWNIEFGHTTMEHRDTLPMVGSLEKLFDLRQGFQYSNWGYAVADEVISSLSGELSWGTALQHAIFEPLGMSRTITNSDSDLENRVEPYTALSNCTPYHLDPRPQIGDGKIMQGAIGVQSTLHDLLVYYKALLSGLRDQAQQSTTTSPDNPLVQVPMMMQGHAKMFSLPSGNENSYALGWARTQLPAPMGSIGLNPTYIPNMPVVGEGLEKPQLCFWHQGSNMCSLHFVALLPEIDTAVLVLSNGLANNDVSDWIGQLLLQNVLGVEPTVEYLELAKTSAKNSNARWPKIKTDLENERTPGTVPLPLASYEGRFYNKINTFFIEIKVQDDRLQLCFQGNHDFWYSMEHFEHDVFTWALTRDENAHRGRFPVTWRNFYKIRFQRGQDNRIDSLIWENDGSWSAGEEYHRSKPQSNGQL